MFYAITCLGVAAGIQLLEVARIHFQAYQELKSGV